MSLPSEERTAMLPFELLLDQKEIARRVTELGEQISEDYVDEVPVFLGVLKGCVVFLSDLMRAVSVPVELEFVSASSYRKGAHREDNVTFGSAFSIPLKGRHVVIVDGVVDTGRTVASVIKQVKAMEPASIEIAAMVNKPASHRVKLGIKYRGFTVGNEFVIGYGLDNTQRYRNLPFIGRMVD